MFSSSFAPPDDLAVRHTPYQPWASRPATGRSPAPCASSTASSSRRPLHANRAPPGNVSAGDAVLAGREEEMIISGDAGGARGRFAYRAAVTDAAGPAPGGP